MVVVYCVSKVQGLRGYKLVLADAGNAAVVLIASSLIEHTGVDDMSNGDVQVVGTQMLQQVQRLAIHRLGHQDRPQGSA